MYIICFLDPVRIIFTGSLPLLILMSIFALTYKL